MRKEDMVTTYKGKIVNDVLFQMSEYIFGITKTDWICGTDYNPSIQLAAVFEIINREEYDLMDEDDDPAFPYSVQVSLMVHPKFFSKKFFELFKEDDVIDEDGKYPIECALYDAHAYMGGININMESVRGEKCDMETEVVENDYGTYRNFKSDDDAKRYIEEVYCKNMGAVMGLIGFYLDRPWNRLGTTGWDSICTMTQGKDLFLPAFDRMKTHLKGDE